MEPFVELQARRETAAQRAQWTLRLLLVVVALAGFMLAIGLLHLAVLFGGGPPAPWMRATTIFLRLVGWCIAFAQLATVVAWLLWQHTAYSNLGLVGLGTRDASPGWAVACWFIPLVNFFAPYRILKELWLRSESENDQESIKDLRAPTPVSLWWGAWILFLLRGGFIPRSGRLITVTAYLVFAALIVLLAALLAVKVVRGIQKRQEAWRSPAVEVFA
jgi:hypothetical protein